jgi:lipoate-protein ligase A
VTFIRFAGPHNMAQDEELLNRAEQGVAGWRVYGWDGPWVSLGRFQIPQEALVDPEAVPWVMRPTGGLAVLHGHDVTVGLAAPLAQLTGWADSEIEAQPDFGRSLKTVYRLAISPILQALRACGVPVVLGEEFWKAPRLFDEVKRERGLGGEGSGGNGDLHSATPSSLRRERGASSDCFAAVSPNDVVDALTGLKVCGCALRVTRKAVLVQASIPAAEPLIDPSRIFASPAVIVHNAWDHLAFPTAFEAAVSAAFLARATA